MVLSAFIRGRIEAALWVSDRASMWAAMLIEGADKSRASKNALRHGLSQPIDVKQVGDALDRLQNVLNDTY